MLIALDSDDKRIRASHNIIGFCPECNEQLIPRCGDLNINHWAHYPDSTCNYGEGKTEWHMKWQERALDLGADCEVPFIHNGTKHIADIVFNNRVIELQHSNIEKSEVIRRSNFYVGLPDKRFRCDWIIDYTQNNFKIIRTDRIVANGHHKKGFDCLFNKLYGDVFFDVGDIDEHLFKVTNFKIHKNFESNDYGTKVNLLYNYFGHLKQFNTLFE